MPRRSLHSGPWSSPDDVERVSRLRCFDTIILRDDHSFCQSSPPGEAADPYTIYAAIRSEPNLEQPDDLPVGSDIDAVGGRDLGEAGHGHDLPADRHHEF